MPFVFLAQSAASVALALAAAASTTISHLATSALLDIGADPVDV